MSNEFQEDLSVATLADVENKVNTILSAAQNAGSFADFQKLLSSAKFELEGQIPFVMADGYIIRYDYMNMKDPSGRVTSDVVRDDLGQPCVFTDLVEASAMLQRYQNLCATHNLTNVRLDRVGRQ